MADPPDKGRARRSRAPDVLQAVRDAVDAARREVLLISPYFVPGRRALRSFTTLTHRGVRVAVLTNSLAATDVLAVHGGYARHRRRLLGAGIELHELKRGGQEGQSLFGSSGASLHTKAFVVDGELIFVGSFNFDPRSAYLNTEMGTFARHPVLGGRLCQEYARLADPARSWTVNLERGRLTWSDRAGDGRGRVPARRARHHADPPRPGTGAGMAADRAPPVGAGSAARSGQIDAQTQHRAFRCRPRNELAAADRRLFVTIASAGTCSCGG